MRFHHGGIAPREQLHAHARPCFKNFSVRRFYPTRIHVGRIKEGQDIHVIETGQPPKSSDRRSHLAALDRAEESNRNIRRARHL